MQTLAPYLILAIGLFSIAGGVFGWGFFINSRKARIWVKLFGVGGARIFYVLLGRVVAGVGAGMAAVVIPMGKGG